MPGACKSVRLTSEPWCPTGPSLLLLTALAAQTFPNTWAKMISLVVMLSSQSITKSTLVCFGRGCILLEDRFWEEFLHSHGHVFQEELILFTNIFFLRVSNRVLLDSSYVMWKSLKKIWKHQILYTMGGCQNPWDSQWVNNIYSCLRSLRPFVTFNSRLGLFPSLSPKTIKPCRTITY